MRGVVATVAAVVVAATAAAAAAAAPPPPAENAGSLDDRQQQLLEEVVELHRKLQSHAGSHGALNFSAAVAAAVGKEEAEEDAAPDPMDPVYNNTIVVIVLVLILLSVMFEQGKDWIEDTFGGPDFKNIVAQMFSELTVLGFLGLLTFLAVQSSALTDLSVALFNSDEAIEDVLESLHFTIFAIMIIFIFEIIVIILEGTKNIKRWKAMEKYIMERSATDGSASALANTSRESISVENPATHGDELLSQAQKAEEDRNEEIQSRFTEEERDEYNLLKLRFSRRIMYDSKGDELKKLAGYPNFPLSEYFRLHQRTVLEDLAGLEIAIWVFLAICTVIMRFAFLTQVQIRLIIFLAFEVFVLLWAYRMKEHMRSAVKKMTPSKVEAITDKQKQDEADSINRGGTAGVIPDQVVYAYDRRFKVRLDLKDVEGAMYSSDVSAFTPKHFIEENHADIGNSDNSFQPEYFEIRCCSQPKSKGKRLKSFLCCRAAKSTTKSMTRFHQVFYFFPMYNTDMHNPFQNMVEVPRKNNRDEELYAQFPPAKRLINHMTTVLLLNAVYTAIFAFMVSNQILAAPQIPLWMGIILVAIGTALPFVVILHVLPPAVKDFVVITCIEGFTDYTKIRHTLNEKTTEDAVRFMHTMQGLARQAKIFGVMKGEAKPRQGRKLDASTSKGQMFITDIGNTFAIYDTNMSGDVSLPEFDSVVKALTPPKHKVPNVHEIFRRIDKNNSQTITKSEFVEYMVDNYEDTDHEEEIKEIFKMINDIGEDEEEDKLVQDLKNTGEKEEESDDSEDLEDDRITFAELQDFISKMPEACFPDSEKPDAEELRNLIKAADKNNDGEISIEEFKDLMDAYESQILD